MGSISSNSHLEKGYVCHTEQIPQDGNKGVLEKLQVGLQNLDDSRIVTGFTATEDEIAIDYADPHETGFSPMDGKLMSDSAAFRSELKVALKEQVNQMIEDVVIDREYTNPLDYRERSEAVKKKAQDLQKNLATMIEEYLTPPETFDIDIESEYEIPDLDFTPTTKDADSLQNLKEKEANDVRKWENNVAQEKYGALVTGNLSTFLGKFTSALEKGQNGLGDILEKYNESVKVGVDGDSILTSGELDVKIKTVGEQIYRNELMGNPFQNLQNSHNVEGSAKEILKVVDEGGNKDDIDEKDETEEIKNSGPELSSDVSDEEMKGLSPMEKNALAKISEREKKDGNLPIRDVLRQVLEAFEQWRVEAKEYEQKENGLQESPVKALFADDVIDRIVGAEVGDDEDIRAKSPREKAWNEFDAMYAEMQKIEDDAKNGDQQDFESFKDSVGNVMTAYLNINYPVVED